MTMNSNWRSRSALLASVCIGCSFQNFDYMQKGSSTSSETGGTAQEQGGGAGEGAGAGLSSGGLAAQAGRSTGVGATAGSSPAKAGNGGTGVGGFAGRGGTSSGGAGGTGASAGTDLGASGSALAAGSDSGGASAAAGAGVAGAAGGTFKPVLINPGFEATLTGWTVDAIPTTARPYVFTQWPKSGATNVEGQFELSTWGDAVPFTVKIYQLVTGLVDGKYTFKGWINRGDTITAHLYATGCGGAEIQQNIPLTGVAQWVEVSISNFEVTGGQCTVGIFVDSPASAWLNADAFSFTYNP